MESASGRFFVIVLLWLDFLGSKAAICCAAISGTT